MTPFSKELYESEFEHYGQKKYRKCLHACYCYSRRASLPKVFFVKSFNKNKLLLQCRLKWKNNATKIDNNRCLNDHLIKRLKSSFWKNKINVDRIKRSILQIIVHCALTCYIQLTKLLTCNFKVCPVPGYYLKASSLLT